MTTEAKERKILKRLFVQPGLDLMAFVQDNYNLLIDDLNNMLSTISFTKNFNTEYIQGVEIAAGATVRVEHKMRAIPAYKLVVRQAGGATITDGDYTKNYIELTNTGASSTVLSVIIFRE